jgi:hypothetical protein
MGALGEILGGHHNFVHRKKTYRVGMVDQNAKLAYERWLFQRARDVARDLRVCMTAEQYAAHLKELNDAYLEGEYAFESERGRKSLGTFKGMLSICSILWGCDEAEMLLLIKERSEDVSSLLAVVLRESFAMTDEEIARAAGQETDQGASGGADGSLRPDA